MRNGDIAEASRSWRASTSWTARSSIASWPTATPRRRSARPASRWRRWRGRGAPRSSGRRQDDRREDRRAARDRPDPSADKLKAKIPAGLIEVTRIPGLGPKRVRLLYDHLGISSLEDLKRARTAPWEGRPGLRRQGGGERARGAGRRRGRAAQAARMLLSKALTVGEEPGRAARAPGRAARRARGQRSPPRRHGQGPRHRGRLERPGALSAAFCACEALDTVSTPPAPRS